jgi:Proteasome non-ATPase 26S subunit
MSAVISLARQPFSDLHVAGLRLLGSIVTLPWCQSRLIESAGFIEYLLDRSTERGDRTGLEVKYDVISKLASSEVAASVLPSEILIRLREYVREGPLYVKIESQVAFEKAE